MTLMRTGSVAASNAQNGPFHITKNCASSTGAPGSLVAWHIARSKGRAVGCTRLALVREVDSSAGLSLVGEKPFECLLEDLGTTREQICECSRWIVVPEHRGELGRRLVASTWAVCRRLFAQVAFVLAGTHQKQDLALVRMGAGDVPAVPLFSSKAFDDDLRLLYFAVFRPPAAMEKRIVEAGALLNLESSRGWH